MSMRAFIVCRRVEWRHQLSAKLPQSYSKQAPSKYLSFRNYCSERRCSWLQYGTNQGTNRSKNMWIVAVWWGRQKASACSHPTSLWRRIHTHLFGELLPVYVQLIRPETKLDVTHLVEQTRPETYTTRCWIVVNDDKQGFVVPYLICTCTCTYMYTYIARIQFSTICTIWLLRNKSEVSQTWHKRNRINRKVFNTPTYSGLRTERFLTTTQGDLRTEKFLTRLTAA